MTLVLQPQKVLHLKDELKKKKPKLFGNYIITPKYDGWYVSIDYHLRFGWESPKSSSNRNIPAFEWLKQVLMAEMPIESSLFSFRIIAEAIIEDMEFEEMNGIFNRSVGEYYCMDVKFILHDFLYLNKYGVPFNHNASARFKTVEKFFNETASKFGLRKHFCLPKSLLLPYDYSEWKTLCDEYINAGYEGLVAKQEESIYFPGKRNYSLLKLKIEEHLDCEVESVFQTIGEKGNLNYNLKVICPETTKSFAVRIGRFSDIDFALQHFLTNSSQSLFAEIKTMGRYENGSYRQPTFVRFRNDK